MKVKTDLTHASSFDYIQGKHSVRLSELMEDNIQVKHSVRLSDLMGNNIQGKHSVRLSELWGFCQLYLVLYKLQYPFDYRQ